jgi:hypothetical protein
MESSYGDTRRYHNTVVPVLCLHVNVSYALLRLIMRERRPYLYHKGVPHLVLCSPVVQSCF